MNHSESNQDLPDVIEDFVLWDHDRGITTGSTPQAQWTKLFEEVIELYASLHPDMDKGELFKSVLNELNVLYRKGKIKAIPGNEDPMAHTIDAVGDTMKCLTSVANLSGINLTQASKAALQEISGRKGKLVNGIWEKD